jgi:RNA polymerase sigma-70 factor (ECF subfamily)
MNDLPATRHSLIVQLRAQSGDAWAQLLKIYEAAIYRFCLARGLQPADACDATQEVFAALHQRIDSWDSDPARGSFRGWMFRVARNIAADKVADRARQARTTDQDRGGAALAELAETAEHERTAFVREYRRALLRWAVEEIRPEVNDVSWQAFHMTAIDGVDAGEVASRLGVSVGTVYTAKCRVVAKIREKIARLRADEVA